MGSRVEINRKEQWFPGTVTGLPSHDKGEWGRYCVKFDDAQLGKILASEQSLRDLSQDVLHSMESNRNGIHGLRKKRGHADEQPAIKNAQDTSERSALKSLVPNGARGAPKKRVCFS
jgi:hypothetical protein